MNPASANVPRHSFNTLDRLTLAEIEIPRQYQENIFKLETKYKLLVNDLIEEKILIQQKLYQSFQTQMTQLFELKLSAVQKQQQESKMIDIQNSNVEKEENSKTSSEQINVDISLVVKSESNENINIVNADINKNTCISESQSIIVEKFDVNKTQKRMTEKINNHITRIQESQVQNGKKFKCNDCEKQFKRLNNTQSHVARNHINEKPFKCNQCDKCFVLRRLLNHHRNYHSTKYQCTFCGKKFSDSKGLRRHVRIHTGEKPFKCQYNGCGKSFNQKIVLTKHQQTHTREKAFQCDICHKKLSSAQYLQNHKTTQHSKDKPYQCDECDKSYAVKSQLMSHKNIHTSKYQCQVCGRGNTCESALKRHMSSHH